MKKQYEVLERIEVGLLRDALRYRFLRSEDSRPDRGGTTRRLCVEVHDWSKNLEKNGTGFWSSMELVGNAMDKEVDRQMKKAGWT